MNTKPKEETPMEMKDGSEEQVPYLLMNEKEFMLAKQSMNSQQDEIFTKVTQSIRKQKEGDEKPLRIFISGEAGVGKTFLLNLLREQINRCYAKDAVKVCALTGAAALLINGITVHHMLHLEVPARGGELCETKSEDMIEQWNHVEFLFIEEISMLSYDKLFEVENRLRELKNCEDFFGGVNVLLFGDLFLLPPIEEKPVFKKTENPKTDIHLWHLFTLWELTENMRHRGDQYFIDILRNLRNGELTDRNIEILEQKVIRFGDDKPTLGIYPTNELVDDHNDYVLKSFCNGEFSTIEAQDEFTDESLEAEYKKKLKELIQDLNINKTGGFPNILNICVGAKVRLKSNIDESKRLINGAIGFITKIYETDDDMPSVEIDFGTGGVHIIHPTTTRFPILSEWVVRKMLPLVLAWASTIHLMQGQTLDEAVVYLGYQRLTHAKAYSALSRVKSLEGLYIEVGNDYVLNELKELWNPEVMSELDRMRALNSSSEQHQKSKKRKLY